MGSLGMSVQILVEAIQLVWNNLSSCREEIEAIVIREGKAGLWKLAAEKAKVKSRGISAYG